MKKEYIFTILFALAFLIVALVVPLPDIARWIFIGAAGAAIVFVTILYLVSKK